MANIPGLDTIRGLAGEPPEIIAIDKPELSKVQIAILALNPSFVALIPYCYKCKAPLTWIKEEPDDGRIFTCPSCGRVWVKGEGW